MKSVTGRDFARIVERHGWVLLRVSGSHHIYGKERGAAFDSNSWKQAIEARLAAASHQNSRTFRRRSLAQRSIGNISLAVKGC
jgi:hypothetical protein